MAIYGVQPNGGTPEQFLSLFTSGSSRNPAQMSDSSYDAFLENARTSGGSDTLEYYRQAEAYLNSQAIFYPLYYQSHYFACGSGVSDIVFHPYHGGIDFILAKRDSLK